MVFLFKDCRITERKRIGTFIDEMMINHSRSKRECHSTTNINYSFKVATRTGLNVIKNTISFETRCYPVVNCIKQIAILSYRYLLFVVTL